MTKTFNIKTAKIELVLLINRYKDNHEQYIKSNFNESECRIEFIDKLLELFGWDVQNNSGKKPQFKEVLVESYEQDLGKPDYTMTLNGKSTFFVEAKKPYVDITRDNSCCFQARRYGWSAKHKIVVLTNFENLLIYDTTSMPYVNDKVTNNLIAKYNFSEYSEKYDEIYAYISKENIYNGNFEKIFLDNNSLGLNVDDVFLNQINEWRVEIGQYLYNNGKDIKSINLEIQTLINQIIFLRICEDRDLPLYSTLQKTITEDSSLQNELNKLFEKSNKRYNSGIFKGENLLNDIDKSILKNMISSLYYPISPYDFTVINSNILGEIYELFLSETLIVNNDRIELQSKKESEDRSIVTTPLEIVDYMLERSLDKIISDKDPHEIKKLKIADISCGSGIFLTNLLEKLFLYCENWYEINNKELLEKTYNNSFKLPYQEKKEILLSCIFGADIDIQATEVAKFSLLLKLLEGENKSTVLEVDPILPSLDLNIINGNSLVDFEMIEKYNYSDYISELKPLSWDLINNGGNFDLIIGNPPYVKTEDMIHQLTKSEMEIYKNEYKSSYKQFDKYFLFIERALNLINDNGYLYYIIPNKFIKNGSAVKLRNIITEKNLLELLIDFNCQQLFKNKITYTCILGISKKSNNCFEYNYIEDYNEWKHNYQVKQNILIESTEIDQKPWILTTDEKTRNEFKKIFLNSVPLSEISVPFNGVQTSLNSIYVIKGNEIINDTEEYVEFKKRNILFKIEKVLVKKYFQPTTQSEKRIKTYDILETDKYIIFPYTSDGKIIDANDYKYKEFNKYIKYFYNEIVPKQISGKSTGRDIPNSNESNWYQYGRSQAITEFNNQEKLIVGVMSKDPMFMFDKNNLVIQSGGTAGYCGIKIKDDKYNLHFLSAYLSHPVMTNVMKYMGSDFEGGYYSRGTQVLNELPIIKIRFDNSLELQLFNEITNDSIKIDNINEILKNNTDKEQIITYERYKANLIIKINNNITKLINLKE
jgi:type I restriction-modification system DNA methylase subunit